MFYIKISSSKRTFAQALADEAFTASPTMPHATMPLSTLFCQYVRVRIRMISPPPQLGRLTLAAGERREQ
jgi:hypothetical protein